MYNNTNLNKSTSIVGGSYFNYDTIHSLVKSSLNSEFIVLASVQGWIQNDEESDSNDKKRKVCYIFKPL